MRVRIPSLEQKDKRGTLWVCRFLLFTEELKTTKLKSHM